MNSELIAKAHPDMQKAYDHLLEEFKSIRTGRANSSVVEDLSINQYGQAMALKQLASITTPDATTIAITPWDPTSLDAIEKALREDQSLGANPQSDGKVIHINMPPPTQERREELVRQVGEKVEQCYISLRNVRHEVLNEAKRQLKDKQIGEDQYHWTEKQLDSKIEEFRRKIEEAAEQKRKEIREI